MSQKTNRSVFLDCSQEPPRRVLTSQIPEVCSQEIEEYIRGELERKKAAGEEGGVYLVFAGEQSGPGPG